MVTVAKNRDNLKRILGKLAIYVILIGYTVFLFIPIYSVVVASFISHSELSSATGYIAWPKNPSFDNYKMLFTMYTYNDIPTILIGFFNTIWMSILPMICSLLVAGLAAYAYSSLNFPGKNVLFALQMATMMLPLGAFQIVRYIFYDNLNWVKTIWPIILPASFGTASMILFLKTYFDGLGREIFEAAKIDGAGVLPIFFKMIVPLSIPAFVAQFIFGFVGKYNAYVDPMLYLTGVDELITLQLAIQNLNTLFTGYSEIICAAAIVGMLPLIILYVCLQKLFIGGIAVGGGKE